MSLSKASHLEDDFAELGACFEAAMGFGGFSERENFVDDRVNQFAGDKIEDREEFRFAAHVRTENREVAAEEETQINFRVVAGGRSASDEAAIHREAGDTLVPRRHAHVFDHNVDAALAR